MNIRKIKKEIRNAKNNITVINLNKFPFSKLLKILEMHLSPKNRDEVYNIIIKKYTYYKNFYKLTQLNKYHFAKIFFKLSFEKKEEIFKYLYGKKWGLITPTLVSECIKIDEQHQNFFINNLSKMSENGIDITQIKIDEEIKSNLIL